MIVRGSIRPPGDKSITHRALILAGLLASDAELGNPLAALDVRSTARVLRQLGVDVGPVRRDTRLRITSRDWRAPRGSLRCGNSGTAARLTMGALAGHDFEARLTGDASLRTRPMRRVTEPLIRMGARVEEEGGDGLPLRIHGGRLQGITHRSPVASAQLKSAVLLAGVSGGVPVTVIEPVRSRDHTERLLRYLGYDVTIDGPAVSVAPQPGRGRGPFELEIPGDLSSAAFLVAAALLADEGELLIEGVGVNETRAGFIVVANRMGAGIESCDPRTVGGEPVVDLLVRPRELQGTEVAGTEIPSLIDEVPVLAVLAARATGVTVFRQVGELRVKESDRLGLIAQNLRGLGVVSETQGEDLFVTGTARRLEGRVETAGDHRLAMAFAVLGTAPRTQLRLSETDSVGISYPSFFRDLRQIGGARA